MRDPIILIYIIAVITVLIVVGMLAAVGLNTIKSSDALPNNLAYRAVEPTGFYGSARYYVFDTEGKRIGVSRKVFDRLISLPRK